MALSSLLLRTSLALLANWIFWKVLRVVYNIYFHPLKAFPGPTAARATDWWKAYIEVYEGESMVDVLERLHKQFGDIVRVGPNELHFSNPSAYPEIYNASLRWDKERRLYESFGEDHSSFGLLTYAESKQRKDVLQPMFSRRAILNMQDLVWKNMDHLTEVLTKNNAASQSSDMLFAFRCYAIDTITYFCFAKSVHALDAPDFKAPIVTAMDASLPTFHLFHHFPFFRKLILGLPPHIAIKASPDTAGLTNLQVVLGAQLDEVLAKPSTLEDTPHPIIYHRLLDPEAYKNGAQVPNRTALYEEAQTMMFAGGVTVGDTLMTGFFHIISQPALLKRLKDEVLSIWPNPATHPKLEDLESLPFLTATIKESLRMAPGACSPLLRVVPSTGATISDHTIPPGAIVGMAATMVHRSPEIFTAPEKFDPERWMGPDSKGLEQWLVAFSKGPRSCLGLNLAWCELYIAVAGMVRRFELGLDGTKAEDLKWRDCFTPYFPGRHLRVWCRPVEE